MRRGLALAMLVAVSGSLTAACGKTPDGAPALAYPRFDGESPVAISGYDADAMEPFVSRDGRYLFFNSLNDGVTTSLYYALRVSDTQFAIRGEIAGVNGPAPHLDAVPSMDAAARFFYVSTRDYPAEIRNLRSGRFVDGQVRDVLPVDGDFYRRSPGWLVMDAEISSDGDTLLYVNARFDGGALPREATLGIARREGGRFLQDGASEALLACVNSEDYLVYAPATAADTRELYFTRLRKGTLATEICVATRRDGDDAFGRPERLEIAGSSVEAPTLTDDGQRIYYHKRTDDGRYRLFTMRRR